MKLTNCLATACSLALGFALACDLEKDDATDTGSSVDDEDDQESGDPEPEPEPEDEDEPEDDNDPGDSSTTTAGPPPEGEANAFAMRYADLPDIDVGESGSDSGGEGGEPWQDDDALVVTIASTAQSCEDPYAALPCGGNYSVSFILPPDIQAPGTYQLFDEAFGSATYADVPHPEGDCGWGGGSLDGLLEIEHIDDTRVVGRLLETDAWDFDANIEFDASICE